MAPEPRRITSPRGRATHYTYRFFAPRPGVFWFHSHMLPGPQTFAGIYGAFIVRDPNEASLQGDGTIPPQANTYTVVLSDTEFDANGDVGYLDAGVAVPWAMLADMCGGGDQPSCSMVVDGATVLVNGQDPAAGTPVITAKSGEGIRLRLVNTATNRYFRLSLSNNGSDNKIYRIGGEGGFLEQARLEGGMQGAWDTEYAEGEIVVVASGRSDTVIVPTGNDGDTIVVSGLGYTRGGPSDNNPAGDLIHIVIDNNLVGAAFSIAAGDDILGAGGVDDIKSAATDAYSAPQPFPGHPGDGAGSTDSTITLNAVGTGMTAIDGVVGHFEDSGPDYSQVPFQDTSRYAKTGDLLEFTITNGTMSQHHPFHHHGFSFQPVRVVDNGADLEDTSDDTVLYEFDYAEFVDVIDVFDGQSVVVRMRLDDRPRITDTRQELGAPAPDQFFASGGAAGRWVFHCHLFLHAALGMISELVVVDTDRDGDGFDTSEDCDDFDPTINPLAEEDCNDGVDNNCNGVIDEDLIAPEIEVSGVATEMWPPNHKYVGFTTANLVLAVSDNCAPVTIGDVVIASVSSDEPDDDTGDGHTINDIIIADDCTSVQLRRERAGSGNGRVYTINLQLSDGNGNLGTASCQVTVPQNKAGDPAIDDGPDHTVNGDCGED